METNLSTPDRVTIDGPASRPELDLGRMSARCIFATDSLDRVGDVLNVRGIDTSAHQKNPVVLFDHAKWFGDPIGKSVDPEGNYTVQIGEHEAWQTTYFFPTQLGEQYFALIEMGGLNTNSIGYRPTKKRKNNKGGYFLDAVELVELSWVGVPANGECVRAFLARDKICGRSIHPALVKALTPHAAESKTTVATGGFVMKAIEAKNTLAKAAIAMAKSEVPPDAATDDTNATTPTEAPAEVAAEAPKVPQGASMLRSLYDHLAEVISFCDTELPTLENEPVAAEILTLCEGVYESLGRLRDVYASEYPQLEALAEMAEPGGKEEAEKSEETSTEQPTEKAEGDVAGATEEEPQESAEETPEVQGTSSKSYGGAVKRLTKAMGSTIRECAEHLTEMKDADNLTSAQKLVCRHYSKELGAMCEEKAEEQSAEAVTSEQDDMEKAYELLSPAEQKAFEEGLAELVAEQEAQERRNALTAKHNARVVNAAARRNSWRR